MALLELYFAIRDLFWELRAPRVARKWRKSEPEEFLIIPAEEERFFGRQELQSISVRPGDKLKAVIRDEVEGQNIFREFYFEGGRVVAVREYGWVVDCSLPRRAMVRWRNEVDATQTPFRRHEQTRYYTLQDSEIAKISEEIHQVATRKAKS